MSRIRQQEKAKLSREKLMAAADELFARQKISEVGVRDIAARAGVTTGTFYHYFTGKDDILDQIYRSRDADMGGMLHDLAQDTDSYCMKIQSFFVDRQARFYQMAGNLPATGCSGCENTAVMKTACTSVCRN